jgi:hypothetical protein
LRVRISEGGLDCNGATGDDGSLEGSLEVVGVYEGTDQGTAGGVCELTDGVSEGLDEGRADGDSESGFLKVARIVMEPRKMMALLKAPWKLSVSMKEPTKAQPTEFAS